jgi:hypothetical protein
MRPSPTRATTTTASRLVPREMAKVPAIGQVSTVASTLSVMGLSVPIAKYRQTFAASVPRNASRRPGIPTSSRPAVRKGEGRADGPGGHPCTSTRGVVVRRSRRPLQRNPPVRGKEHWVPTESRKHPGGGARGVGMDVEAWIFDAERGTITRGDQHDPNRCRKAFSAAVRWQVGEEQVDAAAVGDEVVVHAAARTGPSCSTLRSICSKSCRKRSTMRWKATSDL